MKKEDIWMIGLVRVFHPLDRILWMGDCSDK